jgi:L-asparaginase
MTEKLLVITTGGTIDGADSDKGTLRLESDAVKWIQKNTSLDFDYLPLFNKDSRLIDNSDRQKILDAITTTDANVCLITHGTFTICETGRFLKKQLKDKALKKKNSAGWCMGAFL